MHAFNEQSLRWTRTFMGFKHFKDICKSEETTKSKQSYYHGDWTYVWYEIEEHVLSSSSE